MNNIAQLKRMLAAGVAVAGMTLMTDSALAHMPWLSSDDQGYAVMWFGESPTDRTYRLPPPIAKIKLSSDGLQETIATTSEETDDLVGLRSDKKIDASREIFGMVTYGLYHGTKLTYHVEHLPQTQRSAWPTEARIGAAYQTLITPSPAGGVSVTVLAAGKPVKNVEVKLYCEEGHEEASQKTDVAGMVTFGKDAVEPGLNAILVNIADGEAKGEFGGEPYSSTTDILTATFQQPGGDADMSDSKSRPESPKVDPNSGVSIAPSNLPDLPEELTSFGATIAGDRLFVYGGHTGSAHSYSLAEQSGRFWSLKLSGEPDAAWQSLPGGPSLQGLALVADGDRVIRIGGFTAVNEAGEDHDLRSQSAVARFDPDSNAWTDLPALPEARSSLDAASLGDKVFVIGGWRLSGDSEESEWHQTAWALDLKDPKATWQAIATPPFKRRAISVASHAGKLYVIGGMTSDGKPTTRVDIYDPANDAWTKGPSIPGSGMSGFGSSSFATGGNLYVSTMDGFVHRLSAGGQTWNTIAKSDPARFFHRMLPASDHELLMIGGANMEVGKFTQIDAIGLP